jgi:exosome complex RNA-binding protein Csl4
MSRGKYYNAEEMMLIYALKRFKDANGTNPTLVTQIITNLTGRPTTGVNTMLSRITPPKEGWLVVDLILNDPTPKETEPAPKKELADYLGQIVRVKCYTITAYGAFCQILGTEHQALLHVSKISDDFIADVSEFIKIGQEFDALVIEGAVPGKFSLDIRNMAI